MLDPTYLFIMRKLIKPIQPRICICTSLINLWREINHTSWHFTTRILQVCSLERLAQNGNLGGFPKTVVLKYYILISFSLLNESIF